MPYIHRHKPWEIRGIKAIDENQYLNRREFISKLGLAGIALAAAPTGISAIHPPQGPAKAPGFSFKGMGAYYPAARNEKYGLDRALTDEYDATHYNNFYEFIDPNDSNIYNVYKHIGPFNTSKWKLQVSGHANHTGNFKLAELIQKLGVEERTYRFRCVERWAMAVPWTGFSLAELIKFFEPTAKATFVRFTSALSPPQMVGVRNQDFYPWPYTEALRMDEAINELSFMATGIFGKPLPKQNGAPIRLVVPWKYGFKNIKSIRTIEFLDHKPATFWNQTSPKEYGFYANVDPKIAHPRWSQEMEHMIPDGELRPTLPYNGYGEWVAKMYTM